MSPDGTTLPIASLADDRRVHAKFFPANRSITLFAGGTDIGLGLIDIAKKRGLPYLKDLLNSYVEAGNSSFFDTFIHEALHFYQAVRRRSYDTPSREEEIDAKLAEAEVKRALGGDPDLTGEEVKGLRNEAGTLYEDNPSDPGYAPVE